MTMYDNALVHSKFASHSCLVNASAQNPLQTEVNGIPVRRFPVSRVRDPIEFAKVSGRVFTETHSVNDELQWLEAEGPTSPALIAYIRAHEADYDFFIFFSVRYPHSYHGARAVPAKAIIVPTAERDSALGLGIYPAIFRGVRALMYNSYEERATIHGVVEERVGARRRGRRRIGDSGTIERGPLPAEVRHARSVHDLRRPHRREQGLRGAVRLSSSTTARRSSTACTWC